MELSGKAKEKFEEWLVSNQDIQDTKNRDISMHHWLTFKGFGALPKSMQYGVYVDFFDSLGIFIETKVKPRQQFNYGIHDCLDWIVSSEFFNDRAKARTKAIEKANDLLNERL